MERKREEPTLGKPDMGQLQFRPRIYRGTAKSEETSPWIKGALVAIAVVIAVMGLIEWNARRSAAAMMRELNRPMTAEEAAQFAAEQRRFAEENARDVEAAKVRTLQLQVAPTYAPPAPLRPGQRCIQGRRYERIENGWKNIPFDPC